MPQIDSVGTYIGDVIERAVSTTKNGYPQFVGRLKAVKKYIGDKDGMAHFGLQEPAYVDWSDFNEDILGYFVLFNDKENFSKESALLNYEQVQIALDWDGQSFESLADNSGPIKRVLFRVEENTYNDNTRLQVSWLDKEDASPERQLKTLDTDALKALSKKINVGKIAKPIAPAKPASASKPGVTKPSPTPAVGVAKSTTTAPAASAPVAAAPVTTPAPAAVATAAPPKAKTKAAPKAPPVVEKSPAVAAAPPACTQTEAWEYVNEKKGDNEDSLIEETWIDACREVGGERAEDTFTPAEWAKIRDIVLRDIAA